MPFTWHQHLALQIFHLWSHIYKETNPALNDNTDVSVQLKPVNLVYWKELFSYSSVLLYLVNFRPQIFNGTWTMEMDLCMCRTPAQVKLDKKQKGDTTGWKDDNIWFYLQDKKNAWHWTPYEQFFHRNVAEEYCRSGIDFSSPTNELQMLCPYSYNSKL